MRGRKIIDTRTTRNQSGIIVGILENVRYMMRSPTILVSTISLLCLPWDCTIPRATGFVIESAALLSRSNILRDFQERPKAAEISLLLRFAPQPQDGERVEAGLAARATHSITRIFLSSSGMDQGATSPRNTAIDPWLEKVVELHDYRERWGDCLVPKRYAENPKLGNWCSKQRQQYRKFVANETPCSLTPDRIETLNRIGFVWNATGMNSNSVAHKLQKQQRQEGESDEHWRSEYSKLESIIMDTTKEMRDSNGEYVDEESQLTVSFDVAKMTALSQISAKSACGKWLAVQRKEYQLWTSDQPSTFNDEKNDALVSLDKYWWMSFRDRVWHIRYFTLISYKEQYGDTLCKISFRSKSLAHWCSNQRKNYNLKMAGQRTTLTGERQAKLELIDFVWNRWEYEFDKKCHLMVS